MSSSLDELIDYINQPKSAEDQAFIDSLIAESMMETPWVPLPGPQTEAYYSEADILGYGGAAGGGKTDLICGKAITQHQNVTILRREATQLGGIYQRFEEIIGNTKGFNKSGTREWRVPMGNEPVITFGSTPNAGDENKYQGRAKDFLALDEAANFLESQARFLMGWVRTVDPNQKTQVLLTFNPPTPIMINGKMQKPGRWIIEFFGPWIDKKNPHYPQRPGTLLWYVTYGKAGENAKDYLVSGKLEVAPGDCIPGTDVVNEEEYPLISLSRTFIPSRVKDNAFLMKTGYTATLQALPEPLRSQMLKGDFEAGIEDDPWQVIPTAWVEAAMARWKPRGEDTDTPKGPMDSMGADIARGGRDKTSVARRHGSWYDKLIRLQGEATIDGPKVAGQIQTHRRDAAPVHVDVIGVGASVYDSLNTNDVHVEGINVSKTSYGFDVATGQLKFFNLRTELWWRMREALDPNNNHNIALHPDPKLLGDLCTPLWEYRGNGIIKVELKEEIIKRLGRSPDDGDAVILANIDTPKRQADILSGKAGHFVTQGGDFDPYA